MAMALALAGCAAGTVASPSASPTEETAPSARATPTPSAPAATVAPAPPTPTAEPAGAPITDLLAAEPPPDFVSTITCEGSIGDSDPVALVRIPRAEGEYPDPVLRDYADITAPRTACTFGSGDYWIHSLIDARHVVISGPDQRYAVVDLPEVRYHWFDLPTADWPSISLIAVAPSLDSVTWRRAFRDDSLARQIVMTDASGEHVLVDLPAIQGGRCGSPLTDSSEGAYARTGESFHVLDQPYAAMNVLLVGHNATVDFTLYPPDAGWDEASMPLMPVWSPTSETLYYRIGVDVMRWNPGTEPEVFLADTPWSRPTFTPDGNYLAYATSEGVFLVDMTRDPAPRLIRADASLPVFLNSAQLWFEVTTNPGCVTQETQYRIYDLRDASEAASIISQVIAVWPATSSSFR